MKRLTCAISTITLLLSGTTITPKLQKKKLIRRLKNFPRFSKAMHLFYDMVKATYHFFK